LSATIRSGGKDVRIEQFQPAGKGKHPVVVLVVTSAYTLVGFWMPGPVPLHKRERFKPFIRWLPA
jgi:hypothetical protein